MHGRPRKAPSQEEQDVSSLKAAKLRELQTQVLHFHHSKIYTKEAVEISAKLLESNPEHYTGWNYRKLAVQYFFDQQSENGIDAESTQSILDEELRVVENALKRNFKSYGAWHHRKWILSKGHSSTDRELRLLGKFQKLDSRNFHAWNYRRFVAGLKKIPDEEELQYTTDMIYDNFSNYSAWHNRSVHLANLLEETEKGYEDKENVLGEEFEFVRNALFTDPGDQSGWFYHLWLLDQTLKREPRFLSSWPHHGSDLHLSLDGYIIDQQSSPVLHFQSKARACPLILYFSEAVKGLSSSSTVTIECEYHAVNDCIWTPLSENNSGFSQAWLTYLKFPDEVHLVDECPVKVTIAQFPGITSLSGMPCEEACHISFKLSLRSGDQRQSEERTTQGKISWKEENFKGRATISKEANFFHSLFKSDTTKERISTSEWSMEIISKEIAHCQELLSAMICKIGKLILARLLMARNTLILYRNQYDGTEFKFEEVLTLYSDLMKMDPVHACYYEDGYSLALLKQLTSNLELLLRHCDEYHESTLPNSNSYLCVRMNGLSLSRIGSMEHLLWVQMLDLSHNKLRSIEGMEALQLLSCLNLRRNKISSFTALDPLKALKSLQVLDVSYNEIGAHSVDTRRYLCPSPLTHTHSSEWHFGEFSNSDANLTDHWDAYLLFKDLDLIQLELMGNAAADTDEQLKAFLPKLMPGLKWLDGETLVCSHH